MNLNQITLPSTDINRSIEFYTKLGLKLIVNNTPSYARFECPEGSSTISVHLVDQMSKSDTVIYFECSELDRTVEDLISKGMSFISAPEDQPWLWREAYIDDPDGNAICLFFAGHNRINPPWRIP